MKKSVKKAIDLTFANWNDKYFGLTDLTEATVYATETQPVVCSASTTGYSEESYFQVHTENWQTKILRDLVEGGNTAVVIEHNLDVIKTADYIIDMGPEGGDGGGTVVATGTPEEIAERHDSYTGYYVDKMLRR